MPNGSYGEGQVRSFKATASMAGLQFNLVAFDGSNRGNIIVANAQTAKPVGVLLDEPGAGEFGEVLLANRGVFVIAGAAAGSIHVGDYLTSDGSAQVIPTTTPGDRVIGIALDEAVAGDRLEMMITSFDLYHS